MKLYNIWALLHIRSGSRRAGDVEHWARLKAGPGTREPLLVCLHLLMFAGSIRKMIVGSGMDSQWRTLSDTWPSAPSLHNLNKRLGFLRAQCVQGAQQLLCVIYVPTTIPSHQLGPFSWVHPQGQWQEDWESKAMNDSFTMREEPSLSNEVIALGWQAVTDSC